MAPTSKRLPPAERRGGLVIKKTLLTAPPSIIHGVNQTEPVDSFACHLCRPVDQQAKYLAPVSDVACNQLIHFSDQIIFFSKFFHFLKISKILFKFRSAGQ